jgi:hypothetical protein
MQVRWNRKQTYNEVSCDCANYAAVLLCSGQELISIEKKGQRTIYAFRFEMFQCFPRFESDFNAIRRRISLKQYFDVYRQLLNGDQNRLVTNAKTVA